MTTVVTDKCLGCRFTDCISVCPVECFHYDDEMLYIDPNDCIDYGACLPECPVHAIYEVENLPAGQEKWVEINAERAPALPQCTESMDPLPGAEERKTALGY